MRELRKNFSMKMSTLVSTTLIAFGLMMTGCETTTTRDDSSTMTATADEPIHISHATMRVDGLGCPMCAESISVLLGNIDAVRDSQIDLSTGTVRVDLDPQIAVRASDLRSAIVDGGFTFRSISYSE